MAIHAKRGNQIVIGLDPSTFAAAPIGVRGLDKMAAAAQLAIQAGHQLQQFFASDVGVFLHFHDLPFAPAGHFFNKKAQIAPPKTLAKNCKATISGINPPNAMVGNAIESTAAPATFDPLDRIFQDLSRKK